MAGSTSTFKRFEKKYLLNEMQLSVLIHQISEHIQPDTYPEYTICNLYFDTDDYAIIRHSIEKPVYKEKLRARSYGIPRQQDDVFFELKKKFKKEVFKRRVTVQAADLDVYCTRGWLPNISGQILQEINYFMNLYRLEPKVFIAYERKAYHGKEDPELRITFDKNIRFRRSHLDLCYGDMGHQVFDDSQVLMEVKARGAMPLWFTEALDKGQLFSTSFSKYGYCYQNYIVYNQRKQQSFALERKQIITV